MTSKNFWHAMIEDARKIPPEVTLDADLCIIGGGPAGITLALELANSGKQVVLLVGGARRETATNRDLYRGFSDPPGSHEPLEENRPRVWGGGTTVWGSRCVPFDPVDFEAREWIPNSGWPIRYEEMAAYQARANELCEAGDNQYDARVALPGTQPEMIAGLDNAELATWPLERWGPPTNFARRYEPPLAAAGNVRVLLHAHATRLQLAPGGGSLEEVLAATSPGRAFRVRAKRYVLACGALENARLLLASNDVAACGVGNESDCVGRYYQSHLFGVVAWAQLRDPAHGFMYEFERDRAGVYCRRRFWLTPEAQRARRAGNAIGFFFRPPFGSAVHRSALFSATYLGKFFLTTLKRYSLREGWRRVRENRRALGEHFRVVLRNAPGLVPQVARLIRQRFFAKRRLPIVLTPRKANHFHLFYQSEHAPNRESRVVLHAEKDDFGMPRLDVRIRFGEADFATPIELHRVLKERFLASGVGDFHYDEDALRTKLAEEVHRFNSNAHHIGTTRMSDDPGHGVVDRHGRVHTVDNLYVAGASVLPTSSHANPTLTLVALTLRLAAHLKGLW
jgi:choline dehydrogenase-like flavoprotein